MATCVTALAVVLLALAPGLGILFMVTAVPALVIAEFQARRRYLLGRPISGVNRARLVVFWIIVLPIVLFLAVLVAVAVLYGAGSFFR